LKKHHHKHHKTDERQSVKIKHLIQTDDAKKLIKIDSDAESDATSMAAFSPRAFPQIERDILSDQGEAGGVPNKMQEDNDGSITENTSRSSLAYYNHFNERADILSVRKQKAKLTL